MKENPDFFDDTETTFHKINVQNKEGNNVETVWIQIIKDESFEDGVIAKDVTEKVNRDMQGDTHKHSKDV